MKSSLADKYKPNRILRVPELSTDFEITSQGTPYLRKNGAMQKVGYLLMRTRLLIDHNNHTISVGFWNEKKNNFDYKIKEQSDEKTL